MPISIPDDKDLEDLLNGKEVDNWGRLDNNKLSLIRDLEVLKSEENIGRVDYGITLRGFGKKERRIVKAYVTFKKGFKKEKEMFAYFKELGLPKPDESEFDITGRKNAPWYQAKYDIAKGPYEPRDIGFLDG